MVGSPLVSIIIPVYNGSNYMREAIDSALAQTYSNIEVIVINDGSDDNGVTDSIAKSYGEKIRYYSKENGGVSSALNIGINQMHGEFFSWLSHDDVYVSNKIESQINCMKLLPNKCIISCEYMQIDKYSNVIDRHNAKSTFECNRIYEWRDALKKILSGELLSGCGLLIPKTAFEEYGMFDESLRFCQDAIKWYELFLGGYSLYCMEDVLVKSRVHENQLTQTGQALYRKESRKICKDLAKKFAIASDDEYKFVGLYLTECSRFIRLKDLKEIVSDKEVCCKLCLQEVAKAYIMCFYGKIRPCIRRCYYLLFRRMRTR